MTDQEKIELLATKVMGWHKAKLMGEYPWYWCDSGGHGKCSVSSWNPLTNIADAWMIVEKMQEKGFAVEVWASPTGAKSCVWIFGEGTDDEWFGEDIIVTQAICEAASKVIE